MNSTTGWMLIIFNIYIVHFDIVVETVVCSLQLANVYKKVTIHVVVRRVHVTYAW